MSKKEMKAIIGMLKRCHGLEAFGTPGKYSPVSRNYHRGVLVMWDPRKLLCEDSEVVQATRIVRVTLRTMADGSQFELIGAYMPNRTDANEEIDASWELLHLEASRPNVLIGGDLNIDYQSKRGSAAGWLHDVLDDHQMTKVNTEAHTYEKGDIRSSIDHWLAGIGVVDKVRDGGFEAKISDHWGVVALYELQVETDGWGPKRRPAPRMETLTKDDWILYAADVVKSTRDAISECKDDPVERLRARQQATIRALKVQNEERERRLQRERRHVQGNKGKQLSTEGKLRADVERWRHLSEHIQNLGAIAINSKRAI